MKTIKLFDPKQPANAPRRLTLPDGVASAFVRAGIAAAADPADSGTLAAGGALSADTPTEITIEHGLAGVTRMARLTVPLAVAQAAAAAGVAGGVTVPIPTGTPPVDTTPPTITSPSAHSVNENSPYSATATANEPVTWAKGGADAALVTLNAATGAWSVAAQDFEVRTTVSFTLTATDTAGNVSAPPQAVVLTIVNLNDTNPSAFAFAPASGVAVGSTQTSPTITIAGLGATDSVTASVSGATSSLLSKNGGAFVSGPVTVVNNDTLAVRHTASASNSTAVATTLSAGTTAATFTSTTVAAASAMTIPQGTPIVVIGPSIQNVVNVRSPRMWMLAASNDHLYPTPGWNQAAGGSAATAEGAQGQGSPLNYYEEPTRLACTTAQLGDATKRGKVLVVYDPGPNDITASGISAAGSGAALQQKMIDAMDRWISRVSAAGHMIQLLPIAATGGIVPQSAFEAIRQGFNSAMASRHAPSSGVFYCGGRLQAFDPYYDTLTYDAGKLHPTAKGAQIIGNADWAGLQQYCTFAPRWTNASAYVNPFGQAANSKGAFTGTGGTLTAGQVTGTVADGWTAYHHQASANAAGTAATGTTCTATAGGTESITVNGKTVTASYMDLRVTGTATSAGIAEIWGAIQRASAANWNWGEYGQTAFLCRLFGASPGTAPSGVRGFGAAFGLLGGCMNIAIETNTAYIGADTGVIALKTTPVASLKVNSTQSPNIGIAWSSGDVVDATLRVYQLLAEQVETVAYAAPFNLSTGWAAGNNPLTQRPALAGTKTVGSVQTYQPPTLSGGGPGLYVSSSIKDASNNVLDTKANTSTANTYTPAAAATIRMTAQAANTYATATVDDGPSYAVS